MTGAEILIQQGRDQAQRDILLLQLQELFGELPTEVIERVQSAESEQILLWARRVVSTQRQSLDELFVQS